MPASYPTSIRVFSVKADTTDVNYAAHINDAQDEIVAIENILGTAPQGTAATVKARIAAIETGYSTTAHTHANVPNTTFTTAGDLLVGTGASTYARLGRGAALQVLRVNAAGTALEYAAPGGETLPATIIDAKGDLITGTANDTPVRLAVGTDGRVLLADSVAATGLSWSATAPLLGSLVTAKGDIVTATAASTPARLAVGVDGRVLTASSGAATGLAWSASAPLLTDIFDAAGDLIVGTGADTGARFARGAANTYLRVNAAGTALEYGALPSGSVETLPASIIDAKGDLIAGSAADTAVRVAVGTNGRALLADSTATAGVAWSATAPLLASVFTAKGQILAGTAASTSTPLPVGANRQMLLANSATATGLEWEQNPILGGYSEEVESGAGTALDVQTANIFTRTLTAATTAFTFTAPPTGQAWTITLFLTQDATGGRLATFPAGLKWPNATAPTPDTTAGRTNIYTFTTLDGGASWFASLGGKGMA
jgi:hypothetical protein